jgi:VWFA-related protein
MGHAGVMRPADACARLAFVALLSPPLLAAPAPARFEADVTLVTLAVFVTDGRGQPVPGLTAADFEVRDDGRPSAVVHCREVDASDRMPAGPSVLPAIQAAARRQFLFLFDLSFAHPAGIVRARNAARRTAEAGLAPSDLAGVATVQAQGGVRVLLGLTTDRRQLMRALDTLGLRDGPRAADALGLTYEFGSGPSAGGDAGKPGWEEHLAAQQQAMKRGERAAYSRGVFGFLSGLEGLARTLGAVHGRKQVLLLSAGYDPTVLVGAQGAGPDVGEMGDRMLDLGRLRGAMDDVTRAFAASDTVVHAVDVGGLVAPGDLTNVARPGLALDGRESLRQISAVTGGRFVRDTNDLATALRQVVDGSRRYYVLAIEPWRRRPGRFHRLQVRVRAGGGTVSHRTGYIEAPAVRTADAATRRLQAAEAIAKGLSGGDIALRAVAVPYRDADGRVTLPVVLEIDGATLLDGRSSGTVTLEVYGYAFDAHEAVLDAMTLKPTVDVPRLGARIRESGFQIHTAFAVPRGRADLRFLVHDVTSGRTGSLRVALVVPEFAPGSVALSPPLVTADARERVVVIAPSRLIAAPEMPFDVAAERFAPQAFPRLVNGRADAVVLLAFTPTPFDAKSLFEISAHFRDPDGARVPIGAPLVISKVVAGADGFRRFFLEVTPMGVPPGAYTLHVRLKDPLVRETAETTQAIHVR